MLLGKINVGQLDEKIVIEQNTPTNDSTTNEEIKVWSTLSTVWGKKMPNIKGGLSNEASQPLEINERDYLIRYSSDVSGIDATMRMLIDSEYYYITNIKKHRREGYIFVTCEYRDNA